MQRLPRLFLIATVHNDAIIPRPVTQIESRFFGLFSTQSKAKVVTCECARVFFMYIVARILDQIQLWYFLIFFIIGKLQPSINRFKIVHFLAWIDISIAKGQLISKYPFGFLKSTKKPTKF